MQVQLTKDDIKLIRKALSMYRILIQSDDCLRTTLVKKNISIDWFLSMTEDLDKTYITLTKKEDD